MIPPAFEYFRPTTIPEAIALLQQHGDQAKILSGGQSLIPAMRYRLARPAVLVDINGIRELAYLREQNGALVAGALARDSELESSSVVARYRLVADASKVVADPVVRQSGTVVGSLCHNDPAGDWPGAAIAGGASVVVRGSKGERVVPIDDFLVDSFTTAEGRRRGRARHAWPRRQRQGWCHRNRSGRP